MERGEDATEAGGAESSDAALIDDPPRPVPPKPRKPRKPHPPSDKPVERLGGPLVHIHLRVTPRHVKVHVHLRVDTALHTARHGRFKQRSRGHRD